LDSDRIVVMSLTFQGHVTSLHGHMTWIPHRPFPIGVLWNEASISNGFRYTQWRMWRNGWRTLIRPLNKVKVHWPSVGCVLHIRDSWSFLERGQNMATEALRPKTLLSWNSLPAELRAPDGFRDI